VNACSALDLESRFLVLSGVATSFLRLAQSVCAFAIHTTGADKKQIKQAYRQAARKYHPVGYSCTVALPCLVLQHPSSRLEKEPRVCGGCESPLASCIATTSILC